MKQVDKTGRNSTTLQALDLPCMEARLLHCDLGIVIRLILIFFSEKLLDRDAIPTGTISTLARPKN